MPVLASAIPRGVAGNAILQVHFDPKELRSGRVGQSEIVAVGHNWHPRIGIARLHIEHDRANIDPEAEILVRRAARKVGVWIAEAGSSDDLARPWA